MLVKQQSDEADSIDQPVQMCFTQLSKNKLNHDGEVGQLINRNKKQ